MKYWLLCQKKLAIVDKQKVLPWPGAKVIPTFRIPAFLNKILSCQPLSCTNKSEVIASHLKFLKIRPLNT